MRSIAAVLLSLSFAMTPLGAKTRPAHSGSVQVVKTAGANKAKKNKVRTRKPKRKVKTQARAN